MPMLTAFAVPESLGIRDIVLRLLCAMTVGMVIGTEREYSNRPAGMRTHILVALGACAVMITGQLIFIQYSAYGAAPDPARLAAQVITGVGFLGAGTILREGANVKGLTTAASLWAVACLGVAAGGGYYTVAIVGMVFIFITLTILETLQNRMIGPDIGLRHCRIETEDVAAALEAVNTQSAKQNAGLRDIVTERMDGSRYRITFRVDIGGLQSTKRRQHFLEGLTLEPAILSVHLFGSEDKLS